MKDSAFHHLEFQNPELQGGAPWQSELQAALLALPFPAYARLVIQLLRASGYGSVRSLKDSYERSALGAGGFDLLAFAHGDLTTGVLAVQVKQYRDLVPRRFVDELRGAMLRLGADQGLLVTTSSFSGAAREAAGLPLLPPVTLINGEGLARLMAQQEAGLTPVVQQTGWRLDGKFFEALAQSGGQTEGE